MEKFAETPLSYPSPEVQELFRAILALKNVKEASEFFRDLLTMTEIKEFANRWQMVKMLSQGKSYMDIAEKLNVSTTTVTRVAYWLYHGLGGYETIAKRLYQTKFKDSLAPKKFRLRGKYTLLKNPIP